MEKCSTFRDRLNYLISREGVNKADIARIALTDKASITRYTNGKYEAKQDVIFRISSHFGLNEAWLMGYNVPMYKSDLPASGISEDILVLIPFISALFDFCSERGGDFSTVVHHYQLPKNRSSLSRLFAYGAPSQKDCLVLSNFLPATAEEIAAIYKNTHYEHQLLSLFRQLNSTAQEHLLTSADVMVQSSKYIKTDPPRLEQGQI